MSTSPSAKRLTLLAALCLAASTFAATAAPALAADLPKPEPIPGRTMLPQEHQYQRQLRAYMATLAEKDFDHGAAGQMIGEYIPPDPEVQYRNYLFTLMPGGGPLVGSKRGVPAINDPPKLFTLANIEGAEAVMKPPLYPEALMQLVQWDYPGNIYHDNRGLKLRCFVNASIALMMLDNELDKEPAARRADWRSTQLIIIGAPYDGFKGVISPEARQAFQDGLKRLARQLMSYGPRGEEPNFDLILPIGLWYAAHDCDDAAFSKEVEAFAKMMFSDPKYFHPAGYWRDRGGIDVGFAGQVHFFTVWAALASDWPFAKESIEKVYRLRAHLTLPEPDGTVTGPSAFDTRLGSPAYADQWSFAGRDHGALMLTDEAACWIKPIAEKDLVESGKNRAIEFQRQINENPVKSGNGSGETPYVYLKNEEIMSRPWTMRLIENYQFPASMVYVQDFYKKGAYAHLQKLEKQKSPWLKFPFAREENFVRDFAGAFVVSKSSEFGAILHTGPLGSQSPDEKLVQLPAPLGFGGGQLSAFWTPATGSVILGRRGGIIHQTPYDKPEEWRTWPIHAVTGMTAEGKVITSARIVAPETQVEAKRRSAKAKVHGLMSTFRVVPDVASKPEKPVQDMYDEPLAGRIDYTRAFEIEPDQLRIETKVTADGKDKVAELCETIPVYLRDAKLQPDATPTTIEFKADGKWTPATEAYQEKVKAVRLTRFAGAVEIEFDQPQRVKLSPAEWKDPVQLSFGNCRNVMIDLMPAGGNAGEFKEAKVAYRIAAARK
ncbi:MAG: hypothetical protein NTW19_15140 [Planctomycetota bacterium]|nr:hypothetical protein [Planctomycetota bacterium]